jgi:hypothetical protein
VSEQLNNVVLYDSTDAKFRTINTGSDTLRWNVNTTIGGDLTVTGTTTTIHSETVLIKDNFLDLNYGYTTATAEAGGLTINYLPTSVTATASAFLASPPRISVNASGSFAANDIVQVSGSADGTNDGLYILSAVPSSIAMTCQGISGTSVAEPFARNQFTASSGESATVTKVTLSVLKCHTDGTWKIGAGATSPLTYASVQTGSDSADSLQGAYDAGATITTASSTDMALTLTSGDFTATGAGAVDLTPTGASSFTSDGSLTFTAGAASTWSTSSGALTIDSAGALTMDTDGTDAINLGTEAAAKTITIGNDASTKVDVNALAIELDSAGTIVGNSVGAMTLTAGAASTWSTSAGLLTLDGAAGVAIAGNASEVDITTSGDLDLNFDGMTADGDTIALTAGADIDIAAASGEIDLTASAIDLNSTGGLTMDSADTTNLTMTANNAADRTLTIQSSNAGAGDGGLLLEGSGRVELTSGSSADGGVSILAGYAAGTGAPIAQGMQIIALKGHSAAGDISVIGVYASSTEEEEIALYAKNQGAGGSATVNIQAVAQESDTGKILLQTGYFDSSDVQQMDGTRGSIVLDTKTIDIDSAAATDILAATTVSVKGATGASFGDDTGTWEFDGSGNVNETGMLTLSATPSGALTMRGGGLSKYGDDVAYWSFDGAGAVSEAGMTSLSATPSGAITLTAAAASTWSTSAGALTLTSAAAANWSTSAGALTLTGASGVNIAGGSSEIDVTTTGAVDINSGAGTWDSSGLSLDASGASNFTTSSGALTLSGASGITNTSTGGTYTVAATGQTVDIDATTLDVDATGAVQLDGAAASHFNATAADLDLKTTTSGDLNLTAADSLTLTAGEYVYNKSFIAVNGDNPVTDITSQIGWRMVAGEAIAKRDMVYVKAGGLFKADSSAIASGMPVGCAYAAISSSATGNVAAVVGSLINPVFDTSTAASNADAGKRVYLSETAGKVTQTPPTTSGSVVYQVGHIVKSDGTTTGNLVAWMPQFMVEIP